MKIIHNIYLVCVMSVFAPSTQAEILQINKTQFDFKVVDTETKEGFEQKAVELYRNKHKVLSHTLKFNTGDCSILTTELGDYEVKNNQLIFYTYWAAGDRQGLWAYPYGVRKQVYSVDVKGVVKPISAVIYVEDVMGNPLEHNPQQDYLQFLNTAPQTDQQKKALNDYIQAMQKQYKARFVNGQEREQLLKEVKTRLAKQIEVETKGWKEDFGKNLRM